MPARNLLGAAAFASLLCGSLPALAETKEVLACYSVCNRTVPDKGKRNECFKACRAEGASQSAPRAAPQAPPQTGSKFNQRSCHVQCSNKFPQGGSARKSCDNQCAAIAEGKANADKDRDTAEKAVAAEEKRLKGAGNVKGKPGPIAERQKALAAYNRALAILKAADRIEAGRAGFIGETKFREKRLRDLQQSSEAQFQRAKGELYVYDPVNMMANQIIKEYNESLKAPRYGAEAY
jgi:hypothetical protein